MISKVRTVTCAVILAAALAVGDAPASASSIFNTELNRAATAHANATYGSTTAFDLWWSNTQTLTGTSAHTAAQIPLPSTDSGVVDLLVNKTNALAQYVKDVTGYDPRVPAQLAYLQAALSDFEHLLDTQRNPANWAAARNWFDTLEYRQYASVNGHDEFRRRLLYQCANCGREIVFASVGGVGGLIYNIAVNGNNTKAIIGASIGAGTGFLIGAIVGLLAEHASYTRAQAEQENRTTIRTLARVASAAVAAAYEAEQAARASRAELGARLDDAERAIAATSTFTGRLRWLWSGHH